jgi:hypothetical protein
MSAEKYLYREGCGYQRFLTEDGKAGLMLACYAKPETQHGARIIGNGTVGHPLRVEFPGHTKDTLKRLRAALEDDESNDEIRDAAIDVMEALGIKIRKPTEKED